MVNIKPNVIINLKLFLSNKSRLRDVCIFVGQDDQHVRALAKVGQLQDLGVQVGHVDALKI